MTNKRRAHQELLKVYGLAILVMAVCFLFAYRFVGPAPSKNIVIATGGQGGAYYAFGQKYAQFFRRSGVELTVRKTEGSLENLSLLNREQSPVDAALVQGGVGTSDEYPHLESLASLYYEPLWLFYRRPNAPRTLGDLRGKRIALGRPGSGTYALATQLLADNHVTQQTAELISLGGSEAVRAIEQGQVDAMFLVSGISADTVRHLLEIPSIAPYSFHRAEAYARNYKFLSKIVLPEGGADLERNIPDRDIILIAPTANLVIGADLHPALMYLFLMAATETHQPGGLLEDRDAFPSPRAVSFPLNKEARRFYRSGPPFLIRVLPFWIATWLVRMFVMAIPLITVLYPLFKIAPPMYNWRVRRKIFKWYISLHDIEVEADKAQGQVQQRDLLDRLDVLEAHVSSIQVPASHMQSQYALRRHIDLMRTKLLNNQR